ncbi:MAG: FAD-dependent pyridine nucleotide-disulfide oxidoreductase [Actinobacteria bacterium]|nr:FAD-dependent pyridine nucleotide-disulfide oxidoreductase [Actinomycetota bacterium]
MASAQAPSEVPLVVVGGGPTGIAALFEARREGIEAVGLEAGPGPTTSIREYLNGLVLISRPTDYEIAGIPLDTRDPNQLTREEVLHYLGRVINYGSIGLRFHAPALELVPQDGRVLVRTPVGDWLARDVVVTAWYRRRRPPPSLADPASRGAGLKGGVEVIEILHDPVAVAGRRPVIVGGGMSAFEHATGVMMHGQPVTIVARHRLPGAFRTPHFETLVRDTGSRIVEGATDLALAEGGLAYRAGDGAGFVACDVLIPCLGHEVDPDVLAMLVAAGLVTEGEVAQVMASPTPDTMIRHGRSVPDAIQAALAAWPDFRTRLLGGVNGIHLAGGGLHIGGAHSGVRVSINTAVVAVRDIAGHPPPDYMATGPLPVALARWVQLPPPEAPWDLLRAIRPIRIAAWTRTNMAMRSRDSFEAKPQPVAAGSPFLLAPKPEDPRLDQVLAMADGSVSVGGMAERLGIADDRGRRELTRLLRYLWWNNALTWLPPLDQRVSG